MARSIQQDIGEAGQEVINRWARAAGLIWTAPDPDRIGVDRLIEIPLDSTGKESPDTAHPGPTAWLQVKTTTKPTLRSWSVNMEICRRFVYSDTPCFFVLLRIDKSENVLEAFIQHVDEGFGASVLKKLRPLKARELRSLHRRHHIVKWTDHDKVRPRGKPVRTCLLKHIGNPTTYAKRKSTWRESIGYPEARTTIQVKAKQEDMIRHMMGEAPRFKASVKATETRFDITKDLRAPAGRAEISLGPSEGEQCSLRIKSGDARVDVPGRFWTWLRMFKIDNVEQIPLDTPLWRFEGGMLALRKTRQRLQIEIGCDANRTQTVRDWDRSSAAVKLLSKGDFSIFKPGLDNLLVELASHEGPLPLDVPSTEAVDTAVRFSDLVGLDGSQEISGAQLVSGHELRAMCLELKVGRAISMRLVFSHDVSNENLFEGPIIQPVWARLGKLLAATCIHIHDGRTVRARSPNTLLIGGNLSSVDSWLVADQHARIRAHLTDVLARSNATVIGLWQSQYDRFEKAFPDEKSPEKPARRRGTTGGKTRLAQKR